MAKRKLAALTLTQEFVEVLLRDSIRRMVPNTRPEEPELEYRFKYTVNDGGLQVKVTLLGADASVSGGDDSSDEAAPTVTAT